MPAASTQNATYSGGDADQAVSPPYPKKRPVAARHGAADADPTPASQRDMAGFPRTGDHYVVWQCVCDGYLYDYAPDFCVTFERARIRAHTDIRTATIAHEGYRYNVIEMYQENIESGTRRCMRRFLWHMSDYAAFQEAQQKVEDHNKSKSQTKGGRWTDTSASSGGWQDASRWPG